MTELSPHALVLLRIHARQIKQFGRPFFIHLDSDTLGAIEKELIDAGLIRVGKKRQRLPTGDLTDKGRAFCKLAGYPE